jgi:hypothetical protein
VNRGPGSPPTIPFRFFRIAIADFKAAETLPDRIDRSTWPNKRAVGTSEQIVAAFQFLDLADEDARPSDRLSELVACFGTPYWPHKIREMLEHAYADLIKLGLDRSTSKGAMDLLKTHYGLDPQRARTATAFYVHASRDADAPLSPFIAATPKQQARKKATALSPSQSDLLERLPAYDETWSDDLKIAWLAAFKELASR